MKTYGGKVIFLDRDNINTDEIIPAKYLTEIERAPLAPHLLEDLKMEGFDPKKVNWKEFGAVVSRSNFGSGSSREMAPWAFEVNGINIVIAENFARIFRENAFNVGMLAIELKKPVIDALFKKFARTETKLQVDFEQMTLTFTSNDASEKIQFNLTHFQKDLVLAGGWVELAQNKY